ncbi:reverse transcriptase domain-containing protein [Tanacetum coccineum]
MFFSSSHSHDPRTMEDFYRPLLIARGGPIAPTTVPGTDFVLKNHMVWLLRQNCQFHGFRDEDAHLNKYLSITQVMKQNAVSQDNISLNLFQFSLTHEAESWFYHIKTHSIHTWEEMILKFLLKYYPYSRALQLRKDILNFQQLPMESVYKAWERFKSCLQKCPNHRILLLNQIMTFYHGIRMIDQDKIMWDAEVYYDTITRVSAHYSETTSALSAKIEVLGKQTAYTIQSVQHQPGPGHPNTVYYSDSDESDEDEPSEVLDIQKPIHSLSGNPTPSSDSVKSSGSTTSHSDLSLPEYESFHFDLLIDPLPPADRSDRSDSQHEEFADELAHIISPPEYDHFYFDLMADQGELTRLLKENISDTSTKDLKINELNDFPLLLSDCDSTFSEEFSEIDLLDSFPSRNKDKIFDPEIFIIKGVQSQRFHILRLDDFSTFSFVSNSPFLSNPSEIETSLSFPFENEDKVFDPGTLLIDEVLYFMRRSPHLLNDNFKIDKCDIFSEISLKIVSSITFHPNDKEIRGEIPYDLKDLRACFQSSNHSVFDHLHVQGIENEAKTETFASLSYKMTKPPLDLGLSLDGFLKRRIYPHLTFALKWSTHELMECPEYIRPSSHRARKSSPTLDEAHLAPKQPIQVNKITSSCEICSGPHDTQYCMENPKQAFVEYASSRINKQTKDEAKEEGSVKSSETAYKDHEMTVKSEEEFEEETKEETKEKEDNLKHLNAFPAMKELGYHE